MEPDPADTGVGKWLSQPTSLMLLATLGWLFSFMSEIMQIYLNEQPVTIAAETTLFALREQHKQRADLLIVNGFPVAEDQVLQEGDRVVLIRRG